MRWRLVSLLLLTFMLAACGGASPPSAQNVADVTATDQAVAPPPVDTSTLDCGPSKPVRQDITLIRNTVENTNGGMKGAFVRSMAFDSYNHAVWLGYGLGVGVGNYDESNWRFCMKLQHVNAVYAKDGSTTEMFCTGDLEAFVCNGDVGPPRLKDIHHLTLMPGSQNPVDLDLRQ